MYRSQQSFLVSLVLLPVLACAAPAPEGASEADRQQLAELREQEMGAFSAGDIEALLAIFTDDALLMPPNVPKVEGAEALRAWLEGLYEQVSIEGRYTHHALTLAGDWAFEEVAFELTSTPVGGGEPMVEAGKGFHVYRRQPDGTWRIAIDVWNTDSPSPTM